MDNRIDFSLVLEVVKTLVSDIKESEMSKECKIDVVTDEEDGYRTILVFENCLGEIVVSQPDFAPYRYVKFEVLSSIDKEFKHVFLWYDCMEDTVETILFQLRKGFDVAREYG